MSCRTPPRVAVSLSLCLRPPRARHRAYTRTYSTCHASRRRTCTRHAGPARGVIPRRALAHASRHASASGVRTVLGGATAPPPRAPPRRRTPRSAISPLGSPRIRQPSRSAADGAHSHSQAADSATRDATAVQPSPTLYDTLQRRTAPRHTTTIHTHTLRCRACARDKRMTDNMEHPGTPITMRPRAALPLHKLPLEQSSRKLPSPHTHGLTCRIEASSPPSPCLPMPAMPAGPRP